MQLHAMWVLIGVYLIPTFLILIPHLLHRSMNKRVDTSLLLEELIFQNIILKHVKSDIIV